MTLTYDIANWMSLVPDSKLISELSIPGTHDSAAMKREGFDKPRLTTQARTIREQLENGVRFLDLRIGYVNNEFGLYHEKFSVNLSFASVRDACRQFLDDHPRETIIASIKNEHDGGGNRLSFRARFLKYVDETPGLWDLRTAAEGYPTLGEVRNKIVLFRRFPLDSEAEFIGINACGAAGGKECSAFPYDTTGTIGGPPTLRIQDKFSLVSIRPPGPLLSEKWGVIENLLTEASGPSGRKDVLYVNFNSAAGLVSNKYPIAAAEFINPRAANYFKPNDQGRFGIIPRDFEGSFADVSVNQLIAHTNVPYDTPAFYLVSKANGQVVDVEGGESKDGTPIIAFPKKTPATGNQLWQFYVSDTPPDFRIGPRMGGVTMDIANTSPTPGARVVANTGTWPDSARQIWTLAPSDATNQYFFIVNNLNGGVVTLDGLRDPKQPEKGAHLATTPRKASDNDDQLWSFVKLSRT